MKRTIVFLIFGLFVIGGLSAQFARGATVYAAVKTVALKSGTGFFAGTRGTLAYGDQAVVLQVKGKWAEIRSTAKSLSGWTVSSNLTSKRIVVAGGTGSASASEIALAGKGFSEEVENAYKAEGSLNYAGVDRTEAQTVSEEELLNFLIEGHLSRGDQ
jgi:hypothetical protein